MKNLTYIILFSLFTFSNAFSTCENPKSAKEKSKVNTVIFSETGGYWEKSNKYSRSLMMHGNYRYVITKYGHEQIPPNKIKYELYVEVYQKFGGSLLGKRNYLIDCIDYPNFNENNYKYLRVKGFRVTDNKSNTYLDFEMMNDKLSKTPNEISIEIKHEGGTIN